VDTEFHALAERLGRVSPRSGQFRPGAPLLRGLETRRVGDRYFWDGMKRDGDPARPFVVFQATLAGAGVFEWHGTAEPLPPGRAFTALIPSTHRYYLPADAPPWSFFFLIVRHPYAVARVAERLRQGVRPVLDLAPDAELLARAVRLFEGDFSDRYAEELALFAFLMAYERHADAAESPRPPEPGDRLREEARRFVTDRLERPADVSELATAYGMSRTRFSHYFRDATGEGPAHFMARVRLEEVARRLLQTDAPLAALARETGFADANHLCKAFRRVYGTTPGAYRRQAR
jgi:AraC-like DNA-binding protein